MDKYTVATVSHNEYKDVLFNKIQSKDDTIGTYEINNISMFSFDDKIYIQNNGYDGLTLVHQS